eukprot:Nk52_evm17s246 gene=Nk52_evmTU17s246
MEMEGEDTGKSGGPLSALGGKKELEGLDEAVLGAQEWAVTNGLIMTPKIEGGAEGEKSKEKEGGAREILVSHTPFTLLPSPFPADQFKKAQDIQAALCRLQHYVSCDHDFLTSTLSAASETDEFTARLLDILATCKAEGISQSLSMGIFRSDYMLNSIKNASDEKPAYSIKQIEMNTISTAFLGLGPIVSRLHKFVTERYDLDMTANSGETKTDDADNGVQAPAYNHLPQQDALKAVAWALAEAHRRYCSGVQKRQEEIVVMMIVQPGERNPFDQRWIEFALWDKSRVKLIRRSLKYLSHNARLESGSGRERRLIVDGKEVSVCYFRAGYTPNDFPSEDEWSARTMIEMSHSVKCPSIDMHISGAKKIQQALAGAGVVEKYCSKEGSAVVKGIRDVFAGLYSLDDDGEGSVDEVIKMALDNPMGFVLKPQREGGGNNLYEEDLVQALRTLSKVELKSYILMERIFPPLIENYIVRGYPGDVTLCDNIVSELGIFSVYLRDGVDNIILNEPCGHILRSKSSEHADGGVAAGVAVLDSPCLL